MHISRSVNDLQEHLSKLVESGNSIGFVPTMGALHQGHMSLVEKARTDCDSVVVSVFVNPTQFNDPNDLANYPRNDENDAKLLQEAGCDLMFLPSVTEVYPTQEKPTYDLAGLDEMMEGAHRPGHFNGVVQVVDRLFSIVQPTKAFFGEKDFQQLAIIKLMMPKLGHQTEIIGCKTLREGHGLAMSSRNNLLRMHARLRARFIFHELWDAKECYLNEPSNRKLEKRAIQNLKEAGLEPEYFEIVDPDTLLRKEDSEKGKALACTAARIEGVRLIDNMMLFG